MGTNFYWLTPDTDAAITLPTGEAIPFEIDRDDPRIEYTRNVGRRFS